MMKAAVMNKYCNNCRKSKNPFKGKYYGPGNWMCKDCLEDLK